MAEEPRAAGGGAGRATEAQRRAPRLGPSSPVASGAAAGVGHEAGAAALGYRLRPTAGRRRGQLGRPVRRRQGQGLGLRGRGGRRGRDATEGPLGSGAPASVSLESSRSSSPAGEAQV